MQPPTAGRFEWPNNRTLSFRPSNKLAYGTSYKIQLNGIEADAAHPRSWVFTFTTIKPLTLSFDDCIADESSGRQLLGFLRQHHIHALMFPLGWCARRYPWLVSTMLADGHRVCNHTDDHPHLTGLSDAQINGEIQNGLHAGCNLLRPPYGDWDGPGGRVARIASQHGYQIQTWDVDTLDWSGSPASVIVRRMYDGGGGVILMHLQGRHTLEALRQLNLGDVSNAA